MSEEEMIKGCVKEDKTCQYALYEAYAGKMLAVCRRYGRTDHEAEDMLQEGFIKVFDNISRFKGEGSFEGWIRRIMVNTALKAYSKNSFRKEVIGLDHVYDKGENTMVIEKISSVELMKLINAMPEGYKLVFNLYALEGFSHAEIASSLGCEPVTSRTQLSKARRWLQQKIAEIKIAEYER
jgi:RNA polymerase sigma factor (sigma-70 family)